MLLADLLPGRSSYPFGARGARIACYAAGKMNGAGLLQPYVERGRTQIVSDCALLESLGHLATLREISQAFPHLSKPVELF